MAASPPPRKCHTCRRVLPADAFDFGSGKRGKGCYRRRKRDCRECAAKIDARKAEEAAVVAARIEARRATWTREDGVRIRRCAQCRRTKVEADEFPVSSHRYGKPEYHSYCKVCNRKRIAAHVQKLAADPERGPELRAKRARWRREWVAANPERARATARAYEQRVREDAVRAQQFREEARMDHRIREARKGHVVAEVAHVPGDTFPRLPAWPLAAVVNDLIAREDRAVSAFDPLKRSVRGECKEVVCKRLGIPARTLTSWTTGERRTADFDVIDKVLQRAGWLWWEVYDEASVRRPILNVRVRDQRKDAPSKPLRWQSVRHLRYGDLGPDREVLALIEQTFTGEGVEVTEQLTLAGTNTLGPPPGATSIEEYRGAMAERRAA